MRRPNPPVLCLYHPFRLTVPPRRKQCWCGDINAPYSVNGEGVCDMPCSGNSDENCGGSYSMDVYAHDPTYLGCFSDPADGRIFVFESSTSSMTAEVTI